jgi:hypothetical protein
VLVSKFGDHLPLYRLEDILVRYGVHIPRSTLCDWVRFAAELFMPLYELQRERVPQSTVMWTDDTPVTVIGGLQGSFQGHFWTYLGYEQPYCVYDLTKSRTRDGPAHFLREFTGYLHADTFAGCDAIFLGPHAATREVPVPRREEGADECPDGSWGGQLLAGALANQRCPVSIPGLRQSPNRYVVVTETRSTAAPDLPQATSVRSLTLLVTMLARSWGIRSATMDRTDAYSEPRFPAPTSSVGGGARANCLPQGITRVNSESPPSIG